MRWRRRRVSGSSSRTPWRRSPPSGGCRVRESRRNRSCRSSGSGTSGLLGSLGALEEQRALARVARECGRALELRARLGEAAELGEEVAAHTGQEMIARERGLGREDRKSTRLNSSHSQISYAVFCL